MRFDSNAGEFSFCWGADYVSMQEQFEACARTHDPQALATLLQLQPWHIGTLLQMVCRAYFNALPGLLTAVPLERYLPPAW